MGCGCQQDHMGGVQCMSGKGDLTKPKPKLEVQTAAGATSSQRS